MSFIVPHAEEGSGLNGASLLWSASTCSCHSPSLLRGTADGPSSCNKWPVDKKQQALSSIWKHVCQRVLALYFNQPVNVQRSLAMAPRFLPHSEELSRLDCCDTEQKGQREGSYDCGYHTLKSPKPVAYLYDSAVQLRQRARLSHCANRKGSMLNFCSTITVFLKSLLVKWPSHTAESHTWFYTELKSKQEQNRVVVPLK